MYVFLGIYSFAETYYYFYPYEFIATAVIGSFYSILSDYKCSGYQDFPEYPSSSQQYTSLDEVNSSSDLQFIKLLFQVVWV